MIPNTWYDLMCVQWLQLESNQLQCDHQSYHCRFSRDSTGFGLAVPRNSISLLSRGASLYYFPKTFRFVLPNGCASPATSLSLSSFSYRCFLNRRKKIRCFFNEFRCFFCKWSIATLVHRIIEAEWQIDSSLRMLPIKRCHHLHNRSCVCTIVSPSQLINHN